MMKGKYVSEGMIFAADTDVDGGCPASRSSPTTPRAHASTKGSMQKSKLDQFFSIPAAAVLMAVVCNVLWGSAFPFIKLGYRLFAIDSADTASILCFAGVRFHDRRGAGLAGRSGAEPPSAADAARQNAGLGLRAGPVADRGAVFLLLLAVAADRRYGRHPEQHPELLWASFWRTSSTAIRIALTPRKALGCALGFGGVLVATLGNHGGGSVGGMVFMLIASVIFALAGPWNKAVTQHADSFSVSVLNGRRRTGAGCSGLCDGGGLHRSAAGIPVLLFLAFISGAGYVIWALLMKNNPVSRIAVFGLIIPIMNVLLSALLNGEPLFEWNYLAALVLVCIGIFLVNRAPQTQETKA